METKENSSNIELLLQNQIKLQKIIIGIFSAILVLLLIMTFCIISFTKYTETFIAEADKCILAINEQIEALDVEQINSAVAKSNELMESMDHAIAKADGLLDTMDDAVTKTNEMLTTVQSFTESIDTVQKEINVMSNIVNGINNRVSNVGKIIGNVIP